MENLPLPFEFVVYGVAAVGYSSTIFMDLQSRVPCAKRDKAQLATLRMLEDMNAFLMELYLAVESRGEGLKIKDALLTWIDRVVEGGALSAAMGRSIDNEDDFIDKANNLFNWFVNVITTTAPIYKGKEKILTDDVSGGKDTIQ
ncbi:MAG: hypothetical protein D6732_08035 [Methanobacteriota archaeon]|nr:MAG: hypothetical protein D6732_08035 [Euryarchaeota archaeon]